MYTRKGRPEDRTIQDNFISLCLWIENEASAEPFTISELYTKMEEISNGSPVYSQRYLKQKLAEHYKDCLSFIESQGRHDVVYLKKLADFIVKNMHESKKDDIAEERKRVINVAENILKAELRENDYRFDVYPNNEDISSI